MKGEVVVVKVSPGDTVEVGQVWLMVLIVPSTLNLNCRLWPSSQQ